MTNARGVLPTLLLLVSILSHVPVARGATNTFREWKRPVMTWVPPYAVSQCKARLTESFDGRGMKDALTHLGLQFWKPTKNGGLLLAGQPNEVNEAAIAELRDWGRTNAVRVLLCVYNHVQAWDWSLARAGFAEHPDKFIESLIAEVDRLQLDGVDIDLEGNGSFEADKETFVTFIRRLSARLHEKGRHLTLDTFSYEWHAPNQTWWKDLLPHVDALTTMGYQEIGANAPEWRSYSSQKAAAGDHASKLMIGLPSDRNEWRGNSAMEHLRWLRNDGQVGVAFWDAQLRADTWRTADLWNVLIGIREGK